MKRLLQLLAAVLLVGGVAGPARALTLGLGIDPAQSSLTPQVGAPASLSGTLSLELGALPPLGANTTFDVVALAASGGGLSIGLDDDLASPGLGVLFTDGTFLIPSLHLEVDGLDLTVTNVAGTFGPAAACGGALCLETGFDVDPGGPEGVITIEVVAAVPEPRMLALLGLASVPFLRRASLSFPRRVSLSFPRRVSLSFLRRGGRS